MATHLLLDLDGVVVFGHPDGGKWERNLERDLGISPTRMVEVFFNPHFGGVVTGKADLFDTLEEIWHCFDTPHSPEKFVDYWFRSHSAMNMPLLEVVQSWHGARFLATNQEHHRAKFIWEDLGLKNYFDGLIYSAQLGVKKPDQLFFEKAQKLLNVEPSQIAFLDDSAENVQSALRCGWVAKQYVGIEDLRELLRIVSKTH